jgi:tetratricopeptide (TPR) repeat protein
MTKDNQSRQNRVREALGKIYDQHPPHFQEYLQRFKEDPTSRVFAPLAEAYRRMGRVDDAIDICREGLEHHPDFHGGRVALAKCYVDKRMYVEAQTELEKVVNTAPDNLLAQRLLGDAYLAQGNKSAALHPYKMALLLSPSDVSLAERVHGLEKALHQAGILEATTTTQVPFAGFSLEEPPAKTMPQPLERKASGVDPLDDLELMMEAEELAGSVEAAKESDSLAAAGLFTQVEEEEVDALGEDERAKIDELLGVQEDEPEEAFKIEHVSAIFVEEPAQTKKEITTGTLGDLYFAQGQYDRALRIFEKLLTKRPHHELVRKINACRAKLGVDREAMVRNRKIHALKNLLKKVRSEVVGTR